MLRSFRASTLAVLAAVFVALSVSNAAAQQPPPCPGGIGDFVWLDQNQNGLRDPGEAGLGINGVVVELRNSSGAVVATRTTGAAVGSVPGSYLFQLICPGTYTVSIVSGVPAGYIPTLANVGSDPTIDSSTSPVTVTLVPGQKTLDVDFGFVTGCTGSIGDRVWNDANQNGIQDAGEAGIPGVKVTLKVNGSTFNSTTTDANGNYTFTGLCAGAYTVEVETPTGFAASPTFGTSDATLDSDASGVIVSLGFNETNPTIDFGFYAPCTGTIGDRIWYDANKNGIQDAGELGIAGVTVGLSDANNHLIASTITNGDGDYLFTGLCAGAYTVKVIETTLPEGVIPTLTSPPGGGDSTNDSNENPSTVTLPGNSSSNLTIDFGYHAPCTGKIGDRVWFDVNGNGIQDSGEVGFPQVRVQLRNRATNAVLAVDVTDAAGNYLFEGLCVGDYIVEIDSSSLPPAAVPSPADQGSNDAVDSDGINDVALVSLAADNSTDLTIDFGYTKRLQLQIVKLTNGTDNNSPTGPEITVGNTVTWTYRVTNSGSTEPLRNVVVTDDNGTPANTADDFAAIFASGDANGNNLLDLGETWVYTATGVAVAGQYVNLGYASAIGNLTNNPVGPVKDVDHYYGKEPPPPPTPGLKLDKSANKDTYVFGEAVTYTYVVTNTGNVPLTNIVVTDDNATPSITSDDFQVGTIDLLGPGQSKVFTVKRVPPTKMCNTDYHGKERKCGLMIVSHHGSYTKFRYFQSRDHRDDYDDHQGWNGRRSYSRKGKFHLIDRYNTTSLDIDGVESDLNDNDEYESVFETTSGKSFVSGDDDSVQIPKVFHKNGWDNDWHGDWDFWWGDHYRGGRWDDDKWGHDNDHDYDYGKHPKPCTTTSTNIATVVAKYGDQVLKATDKATVQIVAPANQAPYKTYTQGGWGAKPSGNNPGAFLSNKFDNVYPGGYVKIGSSSKYLKFTSAYAIEKFLPQGGTPAKLTASYTNSTAQFSVFAGQVLALQLNVDFSAKGYLKSGLGNLTVISGDLEGSTVNEVLALANSVLGGGSLPYGLSISELNSIVSKINENFDGGTQNNGFLAD